MKSVFSYRLLILLLLFTQACQKNEISDPAKYMNWINDPEHGLMHVKYVHGVKITVRYLPPDLQAYQEMKGKTHYQSRQKDSLVRYYSGSRSFLMTLGPDERKGKSGGDIMWSGVSKYEEYKERNLIMNFEMSEYLTLETDKVTYSPVLTNMENTYSLTNERNIYIVFTDPKGEKGLQESMTLDLVFRDELFDTGIHHFIFNKEQLDKVPKLSF